MKKEIDILLEEYREAVKENIEATKAETDAKIKKKKAYYRLVSASSELREKTRELLEQV